MSIRKSSRCFIETFLAIAAAVLLSSTVSAQEVEMPQGAVTLSPGVTTFSINWGVDLPEPEVYSLRFDRGITENIQLGVSGGYLNDLSTANLHGRLNVLRSHDRVHFVAASPNHSRVWGNRAYSFSRAEK
jgi:hypothetical protein